MASANPPPTEQCIDSSAYALPSAGDNEEEVARLDAMHNCFRDYFDGRLCAIQLNEERPRRILELGCGSGAWAIQAAKEFPDAHVFAVDISPLPARALPKNVYFQFVDLATQSLPFEPESFDIVHARMLVVHIADAKSFIQRVAQLVRPGGLLLLDDMDSTSLVRTGGPAVQRCFSRVDELWERRGADVAVGRKLQDILESTGCFSDIQVEKLAIPLGGNTHDEKENRLRLGTKLFVQKFIIAVGERLGQDGLTGEMIQEFVQETDQANCTALWDFYFCAARRSE